MSWLSDTWKGIQSSFDINKMKRDPVGSISKLALIYGLGSAAYGAYDPAGAKKAGDWLKSGFGFYDDPGPDPMASGTFDYSKSGGMSKMRYEQLKKAGKLPAYGSKPGFWGRQIRGVGTFAAKPFDLGMNVNKWIKGEMSWGDVWGGKAPKVKNLLEKTRQMLGTGPSGEPAGRPRDRGQERRKVSHRDFQRGSPAGVARIQHAREGGMYKPNGISQALITGAITPEQFAMIRYGSGGVTAQERNIALEDVGKIKTTLRSAIG